VAKYASFQANDNDHKGDSFWGSELITALHHTP